MEYLYHQLGEALGTVIWVAIFALAGRVLGLWKLLRPKPKPPIPIEQTNAISRMQKDILRELLGKLGAKRCHLTKIHNGDHYVDGSEILRCSRAVEVTAEGVTFEAERFKGMLLSSLLEEQACVEECGPGWFVTDKLSPSTFKHINKLTGTKAGARAAVRKGGEIVAFVGADFDHETKPEDLDLIVQYAHWLEKTL